VSDPRNQRIEDRRNLHCHAVVRFKDAPGVEGRTIDISSRGISVILPEQLPPGTDSLIAFDTVVNGNKFTVAVRAKSIYAILSGSQFRTGFSFTQLDTATAQSIDALYKQLFV
jgi:hypothetical protein